jgi:hypothetical protein
MPDGTSMEETTTVRAEGSGDVAGRDDVAAVASLVHRYAELLDMGDLDGVARLFARAVWRSRQHPNGLRGAEAVRRVFDAVHLYEGSPRTMHVLSNLVIEIDQPTRTASTRCAFTVLQAVDTQPPRPILAGRYHDAFACDDDGWYFTERLTLVDLPGDLTRHFEGRDAPAGEGRSVAEE